MTGPAQFLPWLFPRLMGLVYLIAFLSLLVQLRGLYGSQWILPIASYLEAMKEETGRSAYRLCPTIFWLKSSEAALMGACG